MYPQWWPQNWRLGVWVAGWLVSCNTFRKRRPLLLKGEVINPKFGKQWPHCLATEATELRLVQRRKDGALTTYMSAEKYSNSSQLLRCSLASVWYEFRSFGEKSWSLHDAWLIHEFVNIVSQDCVFKVNCIILAWIASSRRLIPTRSDQGGAAPNSCFCCQVFLLFQTSCSSPGKWHQSHPC